ncbi:MAG: DUF4249 domain-containing protein [Paludibacter sp.]|nr:DUF4249 domain-containing protein [Paludibacter sp.]
MKSIKLLHIILISCTLFSACTSNIVFDNQITESKIVLHSFITPDSNITAFLSLSNFFLSDTLIFKHITNADVSIYINGTFQEKMNHIDKGKYRGKYKPKNSDIVKIKAVIPDLGEVTAQTNFCEAPVITSIDTTMSLSNVIPLITYPNDVYAIDYEYKINYKLKFTDDGNKKNYYRLIVQQRMYIYDVIWGEVLESIVDKWYNLDYNDIVLGSSTSPNIVSEIGSITGETIMAAETYNVFTDELINGKTYTLDFSSPKVFFQRRTPKYSLDTELGKQISLSPNPEKVELLVTLQSIDEEYYYYLKSRGASKVNDYFSEPTQILSNINGGIGYMAGYTSSNVIRFELK